MRILYLDAFAVALNPTASLAPALAGSLGDLRVFGPGLSSAEELAAGALAFAEREGPFDVAIVGPSVPVLDGRPEAAGAAADHLARFAALAPDRASLASGLADIVGAIPRLPARIKAIWLVNFDYYAATPAQVDVLDRLGLVALGPNEQFVAPLDALPDWARSEAHYRRKKERLSDAFRDWLVANPSRVAPIPHFVAESELHHRALVGRRWDVSVPGVEYVQRRGAVAALRRTRLSVAPKTTFHAFRLAGRLGLAPLSRFLGLKLYHGAFQLSLVDTRYVFTARGGFGIPIRKFFEIPAAGALMLCAPPNGFDALGFVPGVTHVECGPDEIADVAADLDRRPDEAQRMASAGRRLVADAHSLGARSSQLRSAFESMLAGTYEGADWVAGRFSPREAR